MLIVVCARRYVALGQPRRRDGQARIQLDGLPRAGWAWYRHRSHIRRRRPGEGRDSHCRIRAPSLRDLPRHQSAVLPRNRLLYGFRVRCLNYICIRYYSLFLMILPLADGCNYDFTATCSRYNGTIAADMKKNNALLQLETTDLTLYVACNHFLSC